MTTWTLIVVWALGYNSGQNLVIPNFTSKATCEVAAQQVGQQVRGPSPAPTLVCIEVR